MHKKIILSYALYAIIKLLHYSLNMKKNSSFKHVVISYFSRIMSIICITLSINVFKIV